MAHTYTPGTGFVVAAGDFLIFLPDDAKPDTLRGLWSARDRVLGTGFLGVLSELTSSLDPTLENLPRFAVVELGAQTDSSREARVAVCGDVAVVVQRENSAAPTVVHGAGAAMWLEERFTDAVSFRLTSKAPDSVTASIPAPFTDLNPQATDDLAVDVRMHVLLPLAEGIVHADAVTWEFEPRSAESVSGPIQISVPETLSSEVSVLDDDFGRTLAELPEEWYSESARSIADEVYEDSISASGSRSLRNSVLESARLPVEVSGAHVGGSVTEVLPMAAADVVPTEVLGANGGNSQISGAGLSGFTKPYSVQNVGMGRVRFSHGEVIELGLPIVVGRKPTHAGSGAPAISRMVSVPSPSKDISRNHLLIHVDQSAVLATDLDSVNGSRLMRRGQPEVDLLANQATLLLSDDVIDLGDGVTLTFEMLA